MLFIVKVSGEIPLKSSRTRPRFEKRLVRNIIDALERNGIKYGYVRVSEGVVYVDAEDGAEGVIKDVFGVHRVCRAFRYSFSSLDDIAKISEEVFKDVIRGRKFAVRVRRVGEHEFTSVDVARIVGARLKQYSAGVDLDNPEVEVFIEVRGSDAYLYHHCVNGVNGLPIGTEGRVLMLVSGGFDSAVASWLVAKRGIEVDFLHYVLGSLETTYRAVKVVKILSSKLYGYEPKIYVIDLTPLVTYITNIVRRDYVQVVLRRYMYLIALDLAIKYGYDAIGTGESVGQASSQTLKNLKVIEGSLPSSYRLPILRPLLSMDKDEIIKLSRTLGTYEESARVRELCAIASGPVTTRADINTLINECSKVGDEFISRAVSNVKVFNVIKVSVEDVLGDFTVEVDFIPENAIVIDVRDKKAYEKWHYPNSVSIYDVNVDSLPKDRPIILYCDSGELSSAWASTLRSKGYNAFSLKGGLSKLQSCLRG